jgi:hypothetical protein
MIHIEHNNFKQKNCTIVSETSRYSRLKPTNLQSAPSVSDVSLKHRNFVIFIMLISWDKAAASIPTHRHKSN